MSQFGFTNLSIVDPNHCRTLMRCPEGVGVVHEILHLAAQRKKYKGIQ